MKKILITYFFLISLSSLAQTREKGPWWPHPQWGPGDQAGASNWVTPEKIVEASKWIRTGKTFRACL